MLEAYGRRQASHQAIQQHTAARTAHSSTHSRAARAARAESSTRKRKEPIRKADWHREKLNTPHFSTLRSQLRPISFSRYISLDAHIIFNPFVLLNRTMRSRQVSSKSYVLIQPINIELCVKKWLINNDI